MLQFRFFSAFDIGKGAFTLFSEMTRDPAFFMEIATLAFKPRNVDDDRPEVHPSVISNAWQVMHVGRGVPGVTEDDTVDSKVFHAWVAELRARASESGRQGAIDSTIGTWLSCCPNDADGLWPCLPVRELLEDSSADSIRSGFVCGVRNNRGTHSRGALEGGKQERMLANRYRGLAESLVGTFPNTSECLRDIARSYEHEARQHDIDADLMREHP